MRKIIIPTKKDKKEKTILRHVVDTWKTNKNDVIAPSIMSLIFTLSFGSAAENIFIAIGCSIFITLTIAATAFISFFIDSFK